MAKSSHTKQPSKPHESTPASESEPAEITTEKAEEAATSKRPASNSVKETAAANRPKKAKATPSKQGSMMPSEQKLENLAAAIAAARDADNLLLILQHVDAAGGSAEVIESIEAYRALKAAVEQTPGE